MVRPTSQKAKAGPSVINLEGTQPGILDKDQRSRLLRHQNSTLSFATFDPYLATLHANDLSRLNLNDEPCRPRRIVIENVPGQGSYWRWVPSARKQEGVDDEGAFPRLIDICGQACFCCQEQWDIYKLDPFYDCYVKFPPALSVVVPKGSAQFTAPSPNSGTSDVIIEEEYDSEMMIIDDENPTPIPKAKRKSSPREPIHFNFDSTPLESINGTNQKRQAHTAFQSLLQDEEDDLQNRNTKRYESKNWKRSRTAPPNSGRIAASALRTKHESKKKVRMKQEMEARRDARDRKFMTEIFSEVPPCSAPSNGASFDDTKGNCQSGDGGQEQTHEDLIAESRKRMAELNSDRVNERLRERELCTLDNTRPKHRPQAYGSHEDADRRRTAEEDKRKREAEAAAEEKRRREESQRQRAELLKKLARERAQRHEQWNRGLWTTARAIERYKSACAFFDAANFSPDTLPLVFIDIPWPTLRHPKLNRPEDIDWDSTNEFFQTLQLSLRGPIYKNFVKASLQRFHPDRWSGRNLFSAILDDDERYEIETAVNTLSKALGGIYADVRSM